MKNNNIIQFESAKERLELIKRKEIIRKICERTDEHFYVGKPNSNSNSNSNDKDN